MFVYRESYYLEKQEPRPATVEQRIAAKVNDINLAEIIIGKQRHGPTGNICSNLKQCLLNLKILKLVNLKYIVLLMISKLYQKNIIEKPKLIFFLLILALISFLDIIPKDFRLDASSDTLLIDGDPDLKYLREVTERYGSKDFLVLTYSPKADMTSESSINNLLSLKYKIQSLDWVHSVITLLDIPLLNNSEAPLMERLNNFVATKDEGVDKEKGFNEILNSPVFRNFVISEDGNTTGIIVNIKKDEIIKNIKDKKELEKHKDLIKKNHQNILKLER